MASTLACTHMLREMGKEVVAYNVDGCPDQFRFLPGAEDITSQLPAAADVGIVLDASALERADSTLRDCCDLLVNIDHHPYSEDFGEYYWVDTQASATGVMVYRLLEALEQPLTLPVAMCVYSAVISDTGSFHYANANPEAFRVAAACVEAGVDPWAIAEGLFENQPLPRLQLLARVLNTLTISSCGRFASVYSTQDMFAATGTNGEVTDGFVNYPRSLKGVEVGVFFRPVDQNNTYKISMRSKGQVDVGTLGRRLGGGGHHNAAGAQLQGPVEELQQQVFAALARELDA